MNFHDPRITSSNFEHLTKKNKLDNVFTTNYIGKNIYEIFKNGEKVKSIKSLGNVNAYINNEKKLIITKK